MKYEEIRIDPENKDVIKTKVSLRRSLNESTSERKVLTEVLDQSFGGMKKEVIEVMARKYNTGTNLFCIDRNKANKEYELHYMVNGRKWQMLKTACTIAALFAYAKNFKLEE